MTYSAVQIRHFLLHSSHIRKPKTSGQLSCVKFNRNRAVLQKAVACPVLGTANQFLVFPEKLVMVGNCETSGRKRLAGPEDPIRQGCLNPEVSKAAQKCFSNAGVGGSDI